MLRGSGYEFLLAGPADAETDTAWAPVRTEYQVVPGPRRQVGRVWLDTFDGRLRSAGLTLAYLTGTGHHLPGRAGAPAGGAAGNGRAGELVLAGPEGERLRQPAAARWPSLIDAVPAGPVADRLRPIVGIRALLPLARVRSGVREWRVLDGADKTVVRVYLDLAAPTAPAGEAPAALPARLSVVPVRGYQAQAARVARLLAAGTGITADPPTELDVLLAARAAAARAAAAGTTTAVPGPAPAPLDPDQDATAAVAGLLLGLLETIEVNLPGTIGAVDTEFLHDLRVAVRRTRSALKLAGDVLPAGTVDRFAPEFRWLGELTTPMRDLDVFLLGFDSIAAELTEADAADLAPLREYLFRQREIEQRRLRRGLRSTRLTGLVDAWRAVLTPLARPDPPTGRATAPPPLDAATLAQDRIGRAWRRVARRAAALGPASPPEALHDLRKRAKELRYVLELFAGLCRAQRYRALVTELKAVQDGLGAFQDAEVHRDQVRAYAGAMLADGTADAATLLAMGELVARFGAAQRRAAGAAVARVGGLVTEANRRRVAGLVLPA